MSAAFTSFNNWLKEHVHMEDCAICRQGFKKPVYFTSCIIPAKSGEPQKTHIFCLECISECISRGTSNSNACPLCTKEWTINSTSALTYLFTGKKLVANPLEVVPCKDLKNTDNEEIEQANSKDIDELLKNKIQTVDSHLLPKVITIAYIIEACLISTLILSKLAGRGSKSLIIRGICSVSSANVVLSFLALRHLMALSTPRVEKIVTRLSLISILFGVILVTFDSRPPFSSR